MKDSYFHMHYEFLSFDSNIFMFFDVEYVKSSRKTENFASNKSFDHFF